MESVTADQARRRVHIGTSGFVYQHWRGRFYPPEVKAADWLPFYARHFCTVELNTTFYRLPKVESVAAWAGRVPAGFIFAVKGSRYLTHIKRLKDTGQGVTRFFQAIAPLRARTGPILWQLPPQMKRDLPRLTAFLQQLPPKYRYVVEFRNEDWYAAEVFDALDELGVALCIHDLVDAEAPFPPPGPFYYRRFHGAMGKYGGRYGRRMLRKPAVQLAALAKAGTPCFAYFNNDRDADAIFDANELMALVDEALGVRAAALEAAEKQI